MIKLLVKSPHRSWQVDLTLDEILRLQEEGPSEEDVSTVLEIEQRAHENGLQVALCHNLLCFGTLWFIWLPIIVLSSKLLIPRFWFFCAWQPSKVVRFLNVSGQYSSAPLSFCCDFLVFFQENYYWLDRILRSYQSRVYSGDLGNSFEVGAAVCLFTSLILFLFFFFG